MVEIQVSLLLEFALDKADDLDHRVIHVAATGSLEDLSRLVEVLKARADFRLVPTGREARDSEHVPALPG